MIALQIDDIHNVCVIGAGSMGHQIGMLFALGGYQTTIQDVSEEALEKAEEALLFQIGKWVKKGKISEEGKVDAFSRLTFTTSLKDAVLKADFVIEAIVEKLEIKRQLFSELDELTPPHTILATNSSTIVSSLIADVTHRPDKVCNMHFFFPPLVMDCVEVVGSDQTSEETTQLTMALCKKINQTAVLINKEISGFIANRILGALSKEAVKLYEEGYASFEDIDLICTTALKHPIGLFALMDLSGIDVTYFVNQQRYAETGEPDDKPAKCVVEKVQAGTLGRKTGKGWYDYENQKI